ncbi:hypothetical protein ACI79G_07040 [Geodermatophilus sp. SYSU D00779]
MTVTFRIDELRLDTTNGSVVHTFPQDMTVLVGQTGVGKTALLELIKFGLGGDALVAPVARQHVIDVHLSIRAGSSSWQLSRGIDTERRKRVRVIDLLTGERLQDHSVGRERPTISDLLMTSLGLETGLKAAPRSGRSTSAGAQITFNDVFRYMYVPQSEMNRDIAASHDSYYAPKRRAVFELLFGLTNADVLRMRSEINSLKASLEEAKIAYATVDRFLAESGTAHRIDAELRQSRAQQDEVQATAKLEALQGEMTDVADRETQILRDLLVDTERGLADARQLAISLEREHRKYSQERRRVLQDISRLERMESAGERLANIEFAVCPRCTQGLAQRKVPEGSCRVCLQPDVVAGLPARDQYEMEQLQAQLGEIDAQLRSIEDQIEQVAVATASRSDLVQSLTVDIDARTASRVTPRLQAYADAVAKLTRARSEQEALEVTLRQWDRAEDLRNAAEDIEARRAALGAAVRSLEAALDRRKTEIVAELSDEFQNMVTSFGIPSIETASISSESYLPILNGQPFDQVSSAGGIITATQVAYWLSLVTTAVRRGDTYFPAFLLLDSPRLALNTAEDIAAQMYRRFATQVAVKPGRLQFIVADNELPPEYGREFAEIGFSYDEPTVGTIEHPGPAHVTTLVDESDIGPG